jgi:hypothetical protein
MATLSINLNEHLYITITNLSALYQPPSYISYKYCFDISSYIQSVTEISTLILTSNTTRYDEQFFYVLLRS